MDTYQPIYDAVRSRICDGNIEDAVKNGDAKMEKIDMKYRPDAEYKFFLYDPEGDGLMFFRTKEARDEHGQRCIDGYLDYNEWSEEVEGVHAGEVTHIADVLNKRMRPEDNDLDEDGMDEHGDDWPDGMEWRGRYTLEPLLHPAVPPDDDEYPSDQDEDMTV